MKPPIPANEDARLRELHDLNILDTAPESAFDDITFLASFICEVPIALISLVDAERQWFKSVIGLNDRETSRDVSFCAHAIVEPGEILEVPDALNDDRFADNPLVRHDPNIRFYAGAPLVTDRGYALGTLCVIDRVPRTLTTRQKEALSALQRRVSSELVLRRTNDTLAGVMRELSDRNQELAGLNEQKNRMLGMAAHDLRNPIGVISSYSEMLLDETGAPIPELERRDILEEISSTSSHMLSIVNDFLDISNIEAGNIRLQYHSVDVGAMAGHVVGLNRTLAAKKGIAIEFFPSSRIVNAELDSSKVEQVLNNLLTNAVKFSNSGSTIRVSLDTDQNGFRVVVEDEGRGISPENLEHVFQPFSKVQSRGTAGEVGTGLGLSIVRKIIEAHGGHIEVTSQVGKGTRFQFSIPFLAVRAESKD